VTTRASVVNGGVQFAQLGPEGVSLVAGHVRSVEDRGYVVDLGLKHATGFLPFDQVQSSSSDAGADDSASASSLLATGTPINAIVTKVQAKSRVATLSCDPAAWVSTTTSGDELTLRALLPGLRVRATVEGLCARARRGRVVPDVFHGHDQPLSYGA